jgi:pyruvate dehydrogenase E1 component alpha subunit
VDLTALMVEVMGGQSGLDSGWAGHMHLMDPERRIAADGIVGSSAPLAVGQAVAAQQLRPGAVAVAFFGEGALNSGVVLEAVNLAAVWALPVLFVCKDNRWSITTRTSSVTAGDPRARVAAMKVPVVSVRGERVDEVHREAGRLLRRARSGQGPGVLYATCHRPGGHFEGDPLLRILRHPGEQAAELAPGLVTSVRAPTGGSRRDRAAGLSTVASRLVAAAREGATTRRRDPLRHARRLVPPGVADQVHAEERARVVEAASEAVRSLGGTGQGGIP